MLHCNTCTPLLLLAVLLIGLLVSGDADHLMNPTSLIKMNQCSHSLKTTLVNSHTALGAMGYAFTMVHFDTLNWDGTASPPPPCSTAELICIVGSQSFCCTFSKTTLLNKSFVRVARAELEVILNQWQLSHEQVWGEATVARVKQKNEKAWLHCCSDWLMCSTHPLPFLNLPGC